MAGAGSVCMVNLDRETGPVPGPDAPAARSGTSTSHPYPARSGSLYARTSAAHALRASQADHGVTDAPSTVRRDPTMQCSRASSMSGAVPSHRRPSRHPVGTVRPRDEYLGVRRGTSTGRCPRRLPTMHNSGMRTWSGSPRTPAGRIGLCTGTASVSGSLPSGPSCHTPDSLCQP